MDVRFVLNILAERGWRVSSSNITRMTSQGEEDKPIRLDNAGVLNQSVSTSVKLEKVSIVSVNPILREVQF